MFSLDDEKRRVAMLQNALKASRDGPSSDANGCLHRLLVQTRVLTGSALRSAKITADKAFMEIAWATVDIRLSQIRHAFAFITGWAAIMPAVTDDWEGHRAEDTLSSLREAFSDVARMRDAVRGMHGNPRARSRAEVQLVRCRLGHDALVDAEDSLRSLMTILDEVTMKAGTDGDQSH